MTTPLPGCDVVRERLDELELGSLAEAERAGLEAHLAGCSGCREEAAALRRLRAELVSLPLELEPARDLWPGIAARLETPNLVPFETRSPAAAWWTRPALLAAAAAVLVALSSSLTVLVLKRQAPAGAPLAAVTAEPAPGAMIPAAAVAADLAEAERSYEQAAAELLFAIEARRESLAPETVAALDKNLRAVDEALAEVREALVKDPANAGLARLLTTTHKRKVDTLRRVVRLARI